MSFSSLTLINKVICIYRIRMCFPFLNSPLPAHHFPWWLLLPQHLEQCSSSVLNVLHLGAEEETSQFLRYWKAAPTWTAEQRTGHQMSREPARVWNKKATRTWAQLCASGWLRQVRKSWFTAAYPAASIYIQFLELPCPPVATSSDILHWALFKLFWKGYNNEKN